MAKEYDITVRGDGKVVVVLSPACRIGKDDILSLLRELGFDPSHVTFMEPDQVKECDELEGMPVIIPVDEATCDLPELDEAGRHSGDSKGHVVVLCGPGYSAEGLHPIADKYGTQCDWSPDHLRPCILGEAEAPREATGASADRAEACEVKCRR